MKILVLDNYDSFTYNLVHLVEKVSNAEVHVHRNDKISIEQVSQFDKILLSPGPGLPKDAGIMPELLNKYASSRSILGVCLGMQAIGECFGAKLKNLESVYHGVATPINLLSKNKLFANCPDSFNVGRYHSWVIDNIALPNELEITAVDEHNNIMAVAHKTFDVQGVQFHPESILSEYGDVIITNWLKA